MARRKFHDLISLLMAFESRQEETQLSWVSARQVLPALPYDSELMPVARNLGRLAKDGLLDRASDGTRAVYRMNDAGRQATQERRDYLDNLGPQPAIGAALAEPAPRNGS